VTDFDAMVKAAQLQLELRVPKAFIQGLSRTVARTNLIRAKQGQAVTQAEVEQAAAPMSDVMVGKMVNAGAKLQDGDVLVMTLELNNAQMSINGQPPQPLPGTKAGAPAAAAKRK
jgi:uncharacterized protein YdgA (DUF945 family)